MELLNSQADGSWRGEERGKQTGQAVAPLEEATTGTEHEHRSRATPADDLFITADLSISNDGTCCVVSGANFTGKLRFEGAARIESRFAGEILGTATITVAEGALVMAPIRAASVVIAGRVSADVTASKRIEVCPTGRVVGNLTAPAMIVHEDAQVEGRFTMMYQGRPGVA
ncbi:MAG: bactofilin family protein [Candidatus Binataceae bacterium]